LDDWDIKSLKEQDIISSPKFPTVLWGPTLSSVHQLMSAYVPGLKLPELETDQSPAHSAKFKNERNSAPFPPVYLHGLGMSNCTFCKQNVTS